MFILWLGENYTVAHVSRELFGNHVSTELHLVTFKWILQVIQTKCSKDMLCFM